VCYTVERTDGLVVVPIEALTFLVTVARNLARGATKDTRARALTLATLITRHVCLDLSGHVAIIAWLKVLGELAFQEPLVEFRILFLEFRGEGHGKQEE
jgi:hypothetical protein